jgi:RNA polymerase sigma factor (sigma-70 family)
MDKRSDHELLSDFVANASETAFAILVDRHIGLVYSAAFRQLNDAHLAEDVTQAVFVLLARKASTISKNAILTGWLYRTACYASRDVLKSEARRRKREQDATETSNLLSGNEERWEQSAARLDDGLARLAEKDRAALLLRYFEAKTLQEVGEALGCTEEAARKRIDRAAGKLRGYLQERNAAVPPVEIEQWVRDWRSEPPSGAAIRATTAALADGVAIGGNVLALVKSALQFMLLTKLKQILAVLAATASIPAIFLIGSHLSEKRELPTARQVITRHLAASGAELPNVTRRDKPAGTACMSCHHPNRPEDGPLVREIYAQGDWEDRRKALKGTFEIRLAGASRAYETIHVTGVGKFIRVRNESTAWSIAPDKSPELLAAGEAARFENETGFLVWSSSIKAEGPVGYSKFDGRKCYTITERRGASEATDYFDIDSGFRIGSIWKTGSSGSLAASALTNSFPEYQPFDTITFPRRIVRRSSTSEEILTLKSLKVTEVPLRIFDPPKVLMP